MHPAKPVATLSSRQPCALSPPKLSKAVMAIVIIRPATGIDVHNPYSRPAYRGGDVVRERQQGLRALAQQAVRRRRTRSCLQARTHAQERVHFPARDLFPLG